MASLLFYCGNYTVYNKTYDITEHCTNSTRSHSSKLQSIRTNSWLTFTPKHSSVLSQPHRPLIPISSCCVLYLSVCLFRPRISICSRRVLYLSVCLFRPRIPVSSCCVLYLSVCLFRPRISISSRRVLYLSVCLFRPRISISSRRVFSVFVCLLVLSSHPHLYPLRVVLVYLPVLSHIPIYTRCVLY